MRMWSSNANGARDVYFEIEGVELNVFHSAGDKVFTMAWVSADGSQVAYAFRDSLDEPSIIPEAMAAFRHAVAEARAKRWVGIE